MVRKAYLLAAGQGTRLRPITDDLPKCLVPLGTTTLADIWLDRLRGCGVEEVLINTHHLASKVVEHVRLRDGLPSVRISHEDRLLGSAGTVLANRDFVAGESCFWVIYSDNLTSIDLRAVEALHRRAKDPAMTIAAYRTDQPERCGIVEVDQDGRVTSFEEKPARPRSNLANAGIYLCRQEIFDVFPRRDFIDFGFDILPKLVGRLYAYVMTEYILDIGTVENYRRAQQDWPEIVGGLS